MQEGFHQKSAPTSNTTEIATDTTSRPRRLTRHQHWFDQERAGSLIEIELRPTAQALPKEHACQEQAAD
jgi:hypothetical protein